MWGLMSFIRAKTLIKSVEPTTYSTPHWDSRPSHAGGRRLSYHCVIFAPPLFSFIKAVTVSSAESSLCCGEAGEKKKKARGARWEGERKKRGLPAFSLFPSSPTLFLFSIIAIFIGIPSGSLCRGERSSNRFHVNRKFTRGVY